MGRQTERAGPRSRQDWLDAALAIVADTGVPGLKVQELAASLGATTGSLYWHFRDRRSLELALLEHWEEQSTGIIARFIDGLDASPEERLFELMVQVDRNRPTSCDIAMRSWAAHDKEAAKVTRRAHKRRAEVVGGLFRDLGFSGDELAMRTQLFLTYESCEWLVIPKSTVDQRRRLMRARHRLYCRPA
ncbi:MAG: TetR/AcrR family transcriptional regulator [Planctomycetota bacterium]|jgi:AcrR family transcriptional regulator